ncbi:MAG: DMT family transporter [Ilumatobacteraceae bacterium]
MTAERAVAGDSSGTVSGVLWAVATAFSYSLSAVVGKDLLDALGAPSLLFWRFGIATVVLWAVVLVTRPSQGMRVPGVAPWLSLVIGVMFGLLVFVGFKSLETLDASVYIVVVYVYPVIVVVASSLLGHRTSPVMWVALAMVMGGIVLTVPELFGGVGEIDTRGMVLAIAQAVMFAAYMIVNSRIVPAHADGTVTAAWTVLGAALALAPMVVADGLVVPDTQLLRLEVLMFALVPTVIATACFFRAMRRIAPGVVAMIMSLEIALAILWSVLFLGERPRGIQYAGAGVVIAAVLLAQWVGLRDERHRVREFDVLGASSAP